MKIVVLGGGESGCGAAYLARKQGMEVFLSDKGAIKDHYKQFLTENEIEFEEGSHDEARILDCLLYTSPSPRDQRGSRMPSSA